MNGLIPDTGRRLDDRVAVKATAPAMFALIWLLAMASPANMATAASADDSSARTASHDSPTFDDLMARVESDDDDAEAAFLIGWHFAAGVSVDQNIEQAERLLDRAVTVWQRQLDGPHRDTMRKVTASMLRAAAHLATHLPAEGRTRDDALREVANALADMGVCDLARQLVRRIEDGSRHVNALQMIATRCADADRESVAEDILDEALAAIEDLDTSEARVRAFRQLASASLHLGDTQQALTSYEQALKEIEQWDDADSRIRHRLIISRSQAETGLHDAARESAGAALDDALNQFNPQKRSRHLEDIIRHQMSHGLLDDAEAAIEHVISPSERIRIATSLIARQHERSDTEAVDRLLGVAMREAQRMDVLYRPAIGAVLSRDEAHRDLIDARDRIARALNHVERHDEARQWLREDVIAYATEDLDASPEILALSRIAFELLRAGAMDEAIRHLEEDVRINVPGAGDVRPYENIVSALFDHAADTEPPEVLEHLARLSVLTSESCIRLAATAAAYAAVGDEDVAVELFREVEELIAGLEDERDKSTTIILLAAHRTEAGFIDDAMRTADLANEQAIYDFVCERICSVVASEGYLDAARNLVPRLSDESHRLAAWLAIAEAATQHDDDAALQHAVDQASRLLRDINDPQRRSRARIRIAGFHQWLGDPGALHKAFDQARAAIDEIDPPSQRLPELQRLYEAEINLGFQKRAISTIVTAASVAIDEGEPGRLRECVSILIELGEIDEARDLAKKLDHTSVINRTVIGDVIRNSVTEGFRDPFLPAAAADMAEPDAAIAWLMLHARSIIEVAETARTEQQ